MSISTAALLTLAALTTGEPPQAAPAESANFPPGSPLDSLKALPDTATLTTAEIPIAPETFDSLEHVPAFSDSNLSIQLSASNPVQDEQSRDLAEEETVITAAPEAIAAPVTAAPEEAIRPAVSEISPAAAEPIVAAAVIRETRLAQALDTLHQQALASPQSLSMTQVIPELQAEPEPPLLAQTPSREQVDQLQEQLQNLEPAPEFGNIYEGSPAITLSNPSGFGADDFTGFVGFGYQERTRFANKDDGALGVGIGFGDAEDAVGLQLSYTVASFGGSRDFGTGGFNAKLHRRFAGGWGVALGWEGFITTGEVDFEDSIYGSVTNILRTRDDIRKPFSRVALTAGVGTGRFRTEDDVIEDRDSAGVFGGVAVRVLQPVSAIVEWTGQDLAAALSVTPFRNIPIVITPGVRDITGAGDGARFVLGGGVSFKF